MNVSANFRRALATRLAADLATSLTENAALAERLEAKYQRELAAAASLDGMQGTSTKRRIVSSLADRRR